MQAEISMRANTLNWCLFFKGLIENFENNIFQMAQNTIWKYILVAKVLENMWKTQGAQRNSQFSAKREETELSNRRTW